LRRRSELALAIAVAGATLFVACRGDHEHVPEPAMTFFASPLPPEPGKPVDMSFGTTVDVGLVEIFQGDELVASVVNPTAPAPPEYLRFVAKSALVPRAVGYAVNGARVESTATVYVPPPPPPPLPDASAFKDDCVGSVTLPPSAVGMPACGDAKLGLGVDVQIDNALQGPLGLYTTNFPPNQCMATSRGAIPAGTTFTLRSYEGEVIQLVDETSSTTKRELRITKGSACQVVVR
jgi:hypothetical protein